MPTQKVSVTLERSTLERARKVAGPRGLSALIDQALLDHLEAEERRVALLELLEEAERNDPAPPEARGEAQRRAAHLLAIVEGGG